MSTSLAIASALSLIVGGGGVRTLLRTMMYAVAVVAGVDAYLVGLGLAGASVWAQVAVVIVAAAVVVVVATVPLAVYQRVMRRLVARRRAARFATPVELAGLEPAGPEPTDPAEPPSNRPRANRSYGVTSREYRALEWPTPAGR